tara:strand:+ start:137 stop:598 length:462 start_codon:yes stop_codon:yes gene_type:complete
MKYRHFIKKEPFAYFKLRASEIDDLKKYSKIMKGDCNDMLIKTDKDKNIIIVMCDLNFKPFTWADGITVQEHNNSSTLPLEYKSEEDFMFYAERSSVRKDGHGRENIIMPVAVPPIEDYDCFIHKPDQVNNNFYFIEMRTTTFFYTFMIERIM